MMMRTHYRGKNEMQDDTIPTLGEWLKTLPTWKANLFVFWYSLPVIGGWATVLLGYSRARRDPTLPRDALIER